MSDTKVYEPTETIPTPFPQGEPVITIGGTQAKTDNVYNAKENKPQPFPIKRVSHEVISSALNTKSRKIIDKFKFTKQGAIQIGDYKEGVTGDIKISPTGIVARNKDGENTIAIDGESGGSVYKGELQAGSVVTGNIDIDSGGFIALGETVIDEKGLNSLAQFVSGVVHSDTQQSTTSNSYVDVSGSTFTIETDRSVRVLFIVHAYLMNTEWVDYGYYANLHLYDDFLGAVALGTLTTGGNGRTNIYTIEGGFGYTLGNMSQSIEMAAILTVDAGTHNYKLQFNRNGGNGITYLDAFTVNIVILGK